MPDYVPLTHLGVRPGYVLGSMQAGSNLLRMESYAHGFRRGDGVIVECGGEPDGGVRMSVGVGGTWPSDGYANLAAIQAAQPLPATTDGSLPAAYAQDTGDVWYESAGVLVQPLSQFYHHRKFWPTALVATVDAVDGATLVLSKSSVSETTNARVWFDNQRVLQTAFYLPAGAFYLPGASERYAIGAPVRVLGHIGAGLGINLADDMLLFGDGASSEFWAPIGCPSTSLQFFRSDRATFRDFVVRANVGHDAGLLGLQGFGNAYPRPLYFQQAAGVTVEQVTAIGCEWGGLQYDGCVDSVMRRCRMEFPTARHYYLGVWALQFSDATNCHSYDSVIDGDHLSTAAEVFKSVDCSHNNVTARNGQIASNSSHRCWYNGLDITIEADSARPLEFDPLMGSNSTVIIDWNRNATPNGIPQGGGVRNFAFRQTGPIGQGFQYAWAFSRASTLDPAGADITIEDWDVELNGHFTQGVISAIGGPGGIAPQRLNIHRIVGDGRVDLVGGEISDATLPKLRYNPPSVTLGPNLNIPLIEGVL